MAEIKDYGDPLMLCMVHHNVQAVSSYLAKGLPIDLSSRLEYNNNRYSLLGALCDMRGDENEVMSLCQHLIEQGADPCSPSESKDYGILLPYDYAVCRKYYKLASFLDSLAPQGTTYNPDSIFRAVDESANKTLKEILDRGVSPNAREAFHNDTPLMRTTRFSTFELLVSYGADVEQRNMHGETLREILSRRFAKSERDKLSQFFNNGLKQEEKDAQEADSLNVMLPTLPKNRLYPEMKGKGITLTTRNSDGEDVWNMLAKHERYDLIFMLITEKKETFPVGNGKTEFWQRCGRKNHSKNAIKKMKLIEYLNETEAVIQVSEKGANDFIQHMLGKQGIDQYDWYFLEWLSDSLPELTSPDAVENAEKLFQTVMSINYFPPRAGTFIGKVLMNTKGFKPSYDDIVTAMNSVLSNAPDKDQAFAFYAVVKKAGDFPMLAAHVSHAIRTTDYEGAFNSTAKSLLESERQALYLKTKDFGTKPRHGQGL